MRLVLAALSRPMTVVVALIALALCAALAVQRMPVDIFPQVGIRPSTSLSHTAAWTRPRWRDTSHTITSTTFYTSRALIESKARVSRGRRS